MALSNACRTRHKGFARTGDVLDHPMTLRPSHLVYDGHSISGAGRRRRLASAQKALRRFRRSRLSRSDARRSPKDVSRGLSITIPRAHACTLGSSTRRTRWRRGRPPNTASKPLTLFLSRQDPVRPYHRSDQKRFPASRGRSKRRSEVHLFSR